MGTLRIIAGSHGGRRISIPKRGDTRPTAERVREALFSMLGDIEGASVLDLFAGSGALGLEAISRGAEPVVLVDSSTSAIQCIRANLEQLEMEATVIRSDWRQAVRDLSRKEVLFDVVFVDPPYADAATIGTELKAALTPLLAPEAIVVCESAARFPMDTGLRLVRERRHGDTLLRLNALE